jgi:nucleoside-diphosphate-sugar epimerase
MLRPMTDSADTPGFRDVPRTAVVTGSSGFVGQRLVEMLVERGAQRVVAFDISDPPTPFTQPEVETVRGDITDAEAVKKACEGVECVFHVAAIVGPYHEEHTYEAVNYGGSLNVLEACRAHGIRKLVMSSSPSTRFPYPDPNVRGKREDELEADNGGTYSPQFHATYAKTKAMGEQAVLEACSDELMTIAVAPHQVYGPRDPLFAPSILEAARGGRLRIFGDGKNKISMTHVDNYCHGMILGAEALRPDSPALGKFYLVTDKEPQLLWEALDRLVTGVGLPSLHDKASLPPWLMMGVARVTMVAGQVIAKATGKPYPHVMRRLKLNTFAVKMLLIDRWFDISRAERDLEYVPLYTFDEGWAQTIAYFKDR